MLKQEKYDAGRSKRAAAGRALSKREFLVDFFCSEQPPPAGAGVAAGAPKAGAAPPAGAPKEKVAAAGAGAPAGAPNEKAMLNRVVAEQPSRKNARPRLEPS